MGSVPNERKEILMRDPIRWFKCKLKPPKKDRLRDYHKFLDEQPLTEDEDDTTRPKASDFFVSLFQSLYSSYQCHVLLYNSFTSN